MRTVDASVAICDVHGEAIENWPPGSYVPRVHEHVELAVAGYAAGLYVVIDVKYRSTGAASPRHVVLTAFVTVALRKAYGGQG